LCIAAAVSACGGKKETKAASTQAVTAASPQASGCKRVSPPTPKGQGHEKKPKGKLDPAKKWSLVVETNCGSFTIALDVKQAPKTTASLVALAKSGFFDGTTFHRIVPGFVIQGGDPTGTGQGGPGYKTVDKPSAGAGYTRGVVAMAKTQAEAPGTAGSQFFVVTGQDTGLPAEYAVVGRVSQGIDVVARIGQLGDPATESPKQPVVISHVIVKHG
jgi:cyclophilin family peptidyl-prolyl cis-trans isomerase